MKREMHYCDVCGKEMSYIDSDGDSCLQGVVLECPAKACIDIRNTGGSSSVLHSLEAGEFCSADCFKKRAYAWVFHIEAETASLKLKETK